MPRNNRIAPPLPQAQTTPRVDSPVIQRAIDAIFTTLVAVLQVLQPFAQKDPWHDLPLESGWAPDASNPPQYRVDPLGVVRMRGLAVWGSGGTTFSYLPALYRPTRRVSHPVSVETTSNYIVITPASGAMTTDTGSADVCLDGVHFYLGDA